MMWYFGIQNSSVGPTALLLYLAYSVHLLARIPALPGASRSNSPIGSSCLSERRSPAANFPGPSSPGAETRLRPPSRAFFASHAPCDEQFAKVEIRFYST